MDLSFLPKIIEESFGKEMIKAGYTIGIDSQGLFIQMKGSNTKKRKKFESIVKNSSFGSDLVNELKGKKKIVFDGPIYKKEETIKESEEELEDKIEEELEDSIKKVQLFKEKTKAKIVKPMTLKERLETPDSNVKKEPEKKVSKSKVQEVVEKITDDTIEMEKEAFNQLVDKNDHRFNSKSEKIQAEINKNLIEAKDLLRPVSQVKSFVRDTKADFSSLLISKFNLKSFPEEFRKPKINYFVSV